MFFRMRKSEGVELLWLFWHRVLEDALDYNYKQKFIKILFHFLERHGIIKKNEHTFDKRGEG